MKLPMYEHNTACRHGNKSV